MALVNVQNMFFLASSSFTVWNIMVKLTEMIKHQLCVVIEIWPKRLSASALGLYTCIKS